MDDYSIRTWSFDQSVRVHVGTGMGEAVIENTAKRIERYIRTGSFDEPTAGSDPVPKTW